MSQVVESHQKQGRLAAEKLAADLAAHTISNCANQNIFPPQYNTMITDEIIATARMVHALIWSANKIRLNESEELYRKRRDLQKQALQKCDELRQILQIAQKVFHFKARKLKAWEDKIEAVEKCTASWRDSDRKMHLKAIEAAEAEPTQEDKRDVS